MKIRRISLKNVRNFEEKVINFNVKESSEASVIAILGDNGSGKTTILKSIVSALSLYNPIYGGTLLDRTDIKNGYHFYKIEVDLLLNSLETKQLFDKEDLEPTNHHSIKAGKVLIEDESQAIDIFFVEDKDNNKFNTLKTKFSSKNFDGGYIFYFDPFRYLPSEELEGPNSNSLLGNPKENTLSSSILDNRLLNNKFNFIKQWLINMDFKRLKNPTMENEFVFKHVTDAFDSLFAPYLFEKIDDKGKILFRKKDTIIEIDKLSDGFKNLFIIIGEIFFRLHLADSNNSRFFEKEAVIIIDEVDCHIHPKWQVNIVPFLKKMFPRCQFIITTHSPFIVSELDEREILKLEDSL
ncbi:AAA family ATPase [Bacillus infantis]|uniref:AAA family ATPase n=1 Tax=Bacillus infantis TaxID=324767 RepID=UPI0021551A63|nr:AAA family ATPase [Bacillus infantis]MCR6611396.1 AAA family ATPase [Bacillus infantis]